MAGVNPWRTQLENKAKKGFRGWPAGTLAFYGPDTRFASKAVASVQLGEHDEPIMRKWFSDDLDVRADSRIGAEVLLFFREHGVRSMMMPPGLLGCPHEEGIDYEGEYCPQCLYWVGRDRWKEALEPGYDSRRN